MAKEEKKKVVSESLGIAGFVLGIVSIALITTIFPTALILAVIFGIVGLILSIIQLKRKKTGLAISGIIFSALGIIIGILVLFLEIQVILKALEQVKALQSQFGQLGELQS